MPPGFAVEDRQPGAIAAWLRRAVTSSSTTRQFKAGKVIAAEAPALYTHVVLEGWAVRSRILARGRAQIMEVLLTGDAYGAHAPPCASAASSLLAAASSCAVLTLASADLLSLMERDEPVADALRRSRARREAIMEEHLLRLGRRSALERTAHWLCEILVRRAGPAAQTCDLPITQNDLADLLGLSVVHMNRTMRTLRLDHGVTVSRRALTVGDLKGLRARADFDPAYLAADGREDGPRRLADRGSSHARVAAPLS